jgi:hypothetical protein
LVGFEFEARRGTIGGIQISEGLRLVGFTIRIVGLPLYARLFEKIISTPALILTGRVYLVENLYSNKGKHLNPINVLSISKLE